MSHQTDRNRYILPKLSQANYTSLMKLLTNSLVFDPSDAARFRLHVLDHYYKFGWGSAVSAFGVKKSTLYDWKKSFEKCKKNFVSLVPKSTKPKNVRRMNVNPRFVEFIKAVRVEHGNVSKYKLKIFVDEYAKEIGVTPISISLIGKVIKRNNFFFEGRIKAKVKRSRLLYPRLKRAPKEKLPGYIEMDSVTIYVLSRRYYFVTAIDVATKFARAKIVTSLSSNEAKNAFLEFRKEYKQKIRVVQTDNGHEFLGEFDIYLNQNQIKHEFIYFRSPKINGVVERFNRSLQEEFIERERDSIYDTPQFSAKLTKYLVWYNTKRPHQALNYLTPMQYLEEIKISSIPECM